MPMSNELGAGKSVGELAWQLRHQHQQWRSGGSLLYEACRLVCSDRQFRELQRLFRLSASNVEADDREILRTVFGEDASPLQLGVRGNIKKNFKRFVGEELSVRDYVPWIVAALALAALALVIMRRERAAKPTSRDDVPRRAPPPQPTTHSYSLLCVVEAAAWATLGSSSEEAGARARSLLDVSRYWRCFPGATVGRTLESIALDRGAEPDSSMLVLAVVDFTCKEPDLGEIEFLGALRDRMSRAEAVRIARAGVLTSSRNLRDLGFKQR